jgi:hypothetical protein
MTGKFLALSGTGIPTTVGCSPVEEIGIQGSRSSTLKDYGSPPAIKANQNEEDAMVVGDDWLRGKTENETGESAPKLGAREIENNGMNQRALVQENRQQLPRREIKSGMSGKQCGMPGI